MHKLADAFFKRHVGNVFHAVYVDFIDSFVVSRSDGYNGGAMYYVDLGVGVGAEKGFERIFRRHVAIHYLAVYALEGIEIVLRQNKTPHPFSPGDELLHDGVSEVSVGSCYNIQLFHVNTSCLQVSLIFPYPHIHYTSRKGGGQCFLPIMFLENSFENLF